MSDEVRKRPQHPFEVTIRIGGDDWNYVVRTLEELADHIKDHGPECSLASGGGGGCHSVEIQKRDVSAEQFRAELQAWCEQRRATQQSKEIHVPV